MVKAIGNAILLIGGIITISGFVLIFDAIRMHRQKIKIAGIGVAFAIITTVVGSVIVCFANSLIFA